MPSLNNLTDRQIKGLLTVLTVVSVTAGFFMKLVPSEMFSAMVGMILNHFYQGKQVEYLSQKVDEQSNAIQALSLPNPDGKKTNIP